MGSIMVTIVHRLILSCVLIGIGLITAVPTSAHIMQMGGGTTTLSPSVPGQVTILVLDMSSSMSSNDALEIRCSAAEVYIDLSNQEDLIGIIGLTNSDGTRDREGFLNASVWQEPFPVDVESQRQQLKDAIAQRPPGTPSCEHPFGSTPLYDALTKAFGLLSQTTHTPQGDLQGSVVMLTDGQPDSDADIQMDKVRSELIPKFLKNRWPVTTVSLGGQQDYLAFLQDLALQTGGSFYDDTQGHVSGVVSPLNVTDFFIRILAKRQNRTVNIQTSVQTLNGVPWLKDFTPEEHTRHFDVIIAKEQSVTATLTTPEGNTFPPSPPEESITIIDDNPYYEIFSIDEPRPATYQLDISGSGQFLIYNLAISYLQISIISPDQSISVQSLDRPLSLTVQVIDSEHQNEPITGTRFALMAAIRYEGNPEKGTRAVEQEADLSDTGNPGIYHTTFQLPADASPGLYGIIVSVSGDTNASIANGNSSIRLVHTPTVLLSLPQSRPRAASPIEIQQIQWPSLFQAIYNPDIPFTYWLGQLALQQHSLYPQISLDAIIQVDTNSSSHLNITDVVIYPSRGTPQHLHITRFHGRFRFELPRLTNGIYRLVFTLGGTFEDGSFKLDAPSYAIHLVNVPPPKDWLRYAWLVTVLYMLLPFLCLMAYWYMTGPSPFGEALLRKDNNTYHYPFKKVRRNLLTTLFRRNTVYSEMVPLANQQGVDKYLEYMPRGLIIHFCRHGKIKIRLRRSRTATTDWKYIEGDKEKDLHFRWREIRKLIHQLRHGNTLLILANRKSLK